MDTLANRIRRGDTLRGLWQVLPGPEAAEIAAAAGFDWLLLDGEHGPWDPSDLRRRLIAAPDALIRVPANEAWMIKQALDLGAGGLLVPMVDDAEAARAAIAAARYAPAGRRGVGAMVARASIYGLDAGYAARADDLTVWVQAESRSAIENLDAICAVPGIDCVFLGPADLAADMGTTPADPAFHAVLEDAIARIAAAGIAPGIFAADPERWVAAGARVVSMGADGMVLAAGLRGLARGGA
ncbi:2-keto-3-deoxy-L-rhamnonate aldolase [Jannaschia seosinensis]|uniref:2-keto-3-deoxy-L-rhamnonate aldolase n=1 Tax=Jannaschia seosinensis TaxID=313367 RepID=A0A0M7BDM1_9RHOB|nr:aldolase/citrate lyase family protein [Jannaschia seosinensis]CUH40830.1 2-keto-3-deoxy-L-rhamnonate aldolase [Jannaschia seosinensis]